MRILITGSEGVLGQYISQYLEQRDYVVRGLDIQGEPDYYASILNVEALLAIVREYKPDVVVHLAALTSPVESWYRENEYYEVNVLGTANVARVLDGDRLIIFTSSCAVYGDAYRVLGRPIREEDVGVDIPLSPYGMSKLMAEQVLEMHRRQYGIQAVVLRLGNIYSPYDNKYVFWKLWAKKRFILNDPTAVRDFVSVHDLAVLIEKVVEKWSSGADVSGVYNVGHEPLDIGTVVQRFKSITGRPESIEERGSLMQGEFHTMILDTSRTRETFNWIPSMNLIPDGIRWLADGFKKRNLYI